MFRLLTRLDAVYRKHTKSRFTSSEYLIRHKILINFQKDFLINLPGEITERRLVFDRLDEAKGRCRLMSPRVSWVTGVGEGDGVDVVVVYFA